MKHARRMKTRYPAQGFHKLALGRFGVSLSLALSVTHLLSACLPFPSLANLINGNRRIVSNTLPLQQRWTHKIAQFIGDPLSAQGNQVFVWQGELLQVLNAQTGQQQWTLQEDASVSDVTAVSEKAVAYYKNKLLDEEIAVRDGETGSLIWTKPISTTYSFAVGGGCLYVGWIGRVSAYDLQDGRLIWEMSHDLPSHTGIEVYYDAPNLYVTTYNHLYVLDGTNGEVIKSFDYVGTRLEVVSAGVIYGIGWPNVYATVAETGTLRWKSSVSPLAGYIRPTLIHDILYVVTEQGKLLALDAHTGAQKWVGENIDKAFSNVVEFDNHGYVISEDGRLHGFDLATGKEIGQLDTGTAVTKLLGMPAIPSLVVVDEVLVFTFGDSYVYGFGGKSP